MATRVLVYMNTVNTVKSNACLVIYMYPAWVIQDWHCCGVILVKAALLLVEVQAVPGEVHHDASCTLWCIQRPILLDCSLVNMEARRYPGFLQQVHDQFCVMYGAVVHNDNRCRGFPIKRPHLGNETTSNEVCKHLCVHRPVTFNLDPPKIGSPRNVFFCFFLDTFAFYWQLSCCNG